VPALLSPGSGSLTTDYSPTLDWKDATGAVDHYQIQISTSSTFAGTVQDQEVVPSVYTASPDLDPNTRYSWRVRSYNAAGQFSNWSSSRYFRTAILPPDNLTSPDAGLTTRPTFDWDDVSGASGYTIQIAKVSNFSSTIVNTSPKTSNFTAASDLPRGLTLYWRVRANGTNGPSGWTDGASFVGADPPGVPALLSPGSGSLTTDYSPTLDWKDATGAVDHYQIQISTSSTFAGTVQDQEVGPSVYTASPDLDPNTRYSWRVRSYNAAGQFSSWSSSRNFRTALLPPTLSSPGDTTSTSLRRPVFDWADVSGATKYTIQISTSPSFSTTLMKADVSSSTFTPGSNLPLGVTLYWRVRSLGSNGPSSWSEVWTLTVTP
jgi:hypothetical protein